MCLLLNRAGKTQTYGITLTTIFLYGLFFLKSTFVQTKMLDSCTENDLLYILGFLCSLNNFNSDFVIFRNNNKLLSSLEQDLNTKNLTTIQ